MERNGSATNSVHQHVYSLCEAQRWSSKFFCHYFHVFRHIARDFIPSALLLSQKDTNITLAHSYTQKHTAFLWHDFIGFLHIFHDSGCAWQSYRFGRHLCNRAALPPARCFLLSFKFSIIRCLLFFNKNEKKKNISLEIWATGGCLRCFVSATWKLKFSSHLGQNESPFKHNETQYKCDMRFFSKKNTSLKLTSNQIIRNSIKNLN